MLSQQWCFARSFWGINTVESHGKQSWLATRKGCQDPRTPHEGISTLQKAVWFNSFRSTHLRKFYSLDPPPTPTGAGWGLGTSASTISSWYWSIRAHTATQSNLVMFTSAEFWGRYRILIAGEMSDCQFVNHLSLAFTLSASNLCILQLRGQCRKKFNGRHRGVFCLVVTLVKSLRLLMSCKKACLRC